METMSYLSCIIIAVHTSLCSFFIAKSKKFRSSLFFVINASADIRSSTAFDWPLAAATWSGVFYKDKTDHLMNDYYISNRL